MTFKGRKAILRTMDGVQDGMAHERDARAMNCVVAGQAKAHKAEVVITRPRTLALEKRFELRVTGVPVNGSICGRRRGAVMPRRRTNEAPG